MVVTRFAPSPTGYLHIGGLRTALFSYLWARKNGGEFLLRIEDTDMARNSEEALKAIIEAFDWVGLNYDREVYYQSKRFDIYKEYVDKLLQENKAYYCYMSKEELDALRDEQMARGERGRYDRRYRDYSGEVPAGVEPVVRIKAPLSGEISFLDGVKGLITVSADELDDFIIARSDGTPTYNFVVSIDDALMGVTDVIRGDDHVSNTPKQIIIYNALGFNVPNFFHVPMILNPEGKKLSKRDGATDVMEYKSMGFLPESLLNFLVRLGWSHKDQEIFNIDEMLSLFDPKDINKSASAYNQEKLLWLNSHYIKNSSNERLFQELEFFGLHLSSHDKREILLDLLKERAKTLKELASEIFEIIHEPSAYDESGVAKFVNSENIALLEEFLNQLKSTHEELHLPFEYEHFVNSFLKERNLKLGKFGPLLRLAILGKPQSASLFDILSILEKPTIINRVEKFLGEFKNQ